jgi:hypothetical protein
MGAWFWDKIWEELVEFAEDEMHARDCLRLLGEFVD